MKLIVCLYLKFSLSFVVMLGKIVTTILFGVPSDILGKTQFSFHCRTYEKINVRIWKNLYKMQIFAHLSGNNEISSSANSLEWVQCCMCL